ncbi:MAG TPA: ABC transporter ATP-binding protein [Anaerolineae bacterium]|nr:ABC transporter ATP-binding protein [Anaerolineae bacterium]
MGNDKIKYGVRPDSLREYSVLIAVKRLITYIRPYKGMAVSAFVLSIMSSALLVVRPYLIKIAIDNYIMIGNVNGLSLFMLIFIMVYLLKLFVGYALGYITGMIGQKVMHDIRMDIFSHILSMEMSFFDHNQVGRLMTRTTDDVSALDELYTSGAVSILNNSSILIGIIIVMFVMDWKLATVTLTVTPLLYLTGHIFANKIRIVYRNIRRGTARLNAFLQESIQGIRIIQLMRRVSWSHEKFKAYSEELMNSKITNVYYYGLFFPVMEFIGALGLAVILSASGWLIFKGALTIGVMVAFIRLIDMFFWPVREIAENFNVMLSALAASERIFTLLDTPSKIKSITSSERFITRPEIVFDGVWFAYEDELVLKDISFKVAPGERVAFVGPTGAGKTSIINLLLRFYDVTRGRILIDGRDIREIPLVELRGLISFVSQEPFLYNRSVADNISLGVKEMNMKDISAILSRMGADTFFDDFEDGLNTPVRERGSRLSQGQRQLVSFARALAADRKILVLDEATSSIDTFTENLLQKAVSVLMENRTSLVIAHRLSTVRNVDRIYVVARGSIRETGTHSELMELDGIYAKMSKMYMEG